MTPSQVMWRTLSAVIVISSISFFVVYLYKNFESIPTLRWDLKGLFSWVVSVLLAALGVVLVSTIWRLLVVDQGGTLSQLQSQAAVGISQLGKYLPGNIGQHVGRVVLARQYGINFSLSMSTMLLELVLGVAVGVLLGGMSFFFLVYDQALDFNPTWHYMLFAGFALLISPWVGAVLLNRFFRSLVFKITGNERIEAPTLSCVVVVVILFLFCFFSFGLIIKLQAMYLFGVNSGGVFQLTCLFAVAWVGGYVLPGAPGGLGVRESLMVILLAPVLGEGVAAGLSISLRVTTMLGDGVGFLFGLLCKWLDGYIFRTV